MGEAAPAVSDLQKASGGLNKVKTNEGTEYDETLMKNMQDLWNSLGSYEKVKASDKFKGAHWRANFEPKNAEEFAKGICSGLAFDE
mmetsp:Transcript_527/g.1052  ORF Transcript_527/g.1052 Transcript_527/m.1052 type:complete len:86 (-) Transcript_527:182-439(-)